MDCTVFSPPTATPPPPHGDTIYVASLAHQALASLTDELTSEPADDAGLEALDVLIDLQRRRDRLYRRRAGR